MSLGLFAPCSDPAGRTPWAPNWIPGLEAKFTFFSQGALMQGGPTTALNCLPLLSSSFWQI